MQSQQNRLKRNRLKSIVGIWSVTLLVLLLLSPTSHALVKSEDNSFYTQKMEQLQNKLVATQMSKGEWAGIDEGDPRWDVMFMVYTYELQRAGLIFLNKADVDQVVNETIKRLKLWRGFQKDGWALHRNRDISRKLTGSVLLALNHIDPQIVQKHFPTQDAYWKTRKGEVTELSVLDRVIFRMMQAPGYIGLPPVTPTMFASTRDAWIFDTASLGYYRWGFIAVTVWDWYDAARKLPYKVQPMTKEYLDRKGHFVSFPEQTHALGQDFWAREGLAWLLERPFGDGNPSPTLIVQQAFLAAHRAGVMDLSKVLQTGWERMQSLRRPMRNGAKVFQPSISPVWDTARVLRSVQTVPASLRHPELKQGSLASKRAIDFLLSEQDLKGGDYLMATPHFKPGGWGFAYDSSKYPDSDDTAMVVESLLPHANSSVKVAKAVQEGTQWLMQMQNETGGFPAWDFDAMGAIEFVIQNTSMLPNTSLVPQVDVTARVLRTLKHVRDSGQVAVPQSVFDRGCAFLDKNAVSSSSGLQLWRGTWAVNYLYGTSEVLNTSLELGCAGSGQIEQVVEWVKRNQNQDGGWGESVTSFEVKDFVPGKSTINQTLGALQLLLAYDRSSVKKSSDVAISEALERGMNYYLSQVKSDGDISDEQEDDFTACYACPELFVRYDFIPLYMGTEVLGRYLSQIKGAK